MHSADYETNHRQLWEFWGIAFNSNIQLQDFKVRRRHALKIVHSDKVQSRTDLSQAVKDYCKDVTVLLQRVDEEAEKRVGRVQMRRLTAPTADSTALLWQEISWPVQQ